MPLSCRSSYAVFCSGPSPVVADEGGGGGAWGGGRGGGRRGGRPGLLAVLLVSAVAVVQAVATQAGSTVRIVAGRVKTFFLRVTRACTSLGGEGEHDAARA